MSSLLRTSARCLHVGHLRPRAYPQMPIQLARGFADKSDSKDGNQSGASQGRTPPGPKDGAYPKILDEAPPPNPSKEVQEHNKEFENRHDRASNRIDPEGKDQVGKGYWSGDVGREDEHTSEHAKKS